MKSAKVDEDMAGIADRSAAGDKERRVGYHLIELYDVYVRFLTSRTHSQMMHLNLTQWRTLTFIRFHPGWTQRALSTAVGIDPSSMTPIIDVFEAKRWVRRHRSTTNRSAYELRMTEAGLKAYRLVEREIAQSEQFFAQVLGSADCNRLVALLQKLHHTLSAELSQEASPS